MTGLLRVLRRSQGVSSQLTRFAFQSAATRTTAVRLDSASSVRFLSTSNDASKDASASAPASSSAVPPKVEQLEFQAETRQLLDIVTNSLYTDKDVFLRELVSNASDSLEKLRHVQAANLGTILDPDTALEIRIELDEVTSSITITDTGIGMTKEEMISNLGTIARSGSKNFVKELSRMESGDTTLDPARGIIGKFGVGFYSAFMVGEKVEVRSRSARTTVDADGNTATEVEQEGPKVWLSEGTGTYQITELQEGVRQERGTSVVIHLKGDHWDYCDENRIEKILKMYSNFVQFPIYLNGNRVNTVEAIWAKDPKEVTEDEYSGFYKYIANAVDEPLDIYHFRAEVPLDVKALFYVPSFHSEKYGMGRMEPGVSLYSRKVLIESHSPDILPDWMRFVKGVVDSEDLPLAISRERAQDSALIGKLRRALTRKFIAHLTTMVKKDRSKFVDEFYREYSFFLKEGICQDYEFQTPLSKLLFFETSKNLSTDLICLDEYVSRMQPEQKDIFYLVAPTRDAALNSPYLEAFEKAGVDVLLLFTAIEDFVMANLEQYEGRKLVSVEKGDIDLSELTKGKEDDDDVVDKLHKADRTLTTGESVEFCEWFRKELGNEKVSSCTTTNRLTTFPAIVTDNESGAMRRMMRLVDTTDGNRDGIPLPKQHVEINPNHPVIVGIHDLVKTEPALAKVLAAQIFDNALIAAGLLDDSRSMLPRLNDILICVVNGAKAGQQQSSESSQAEEKADDLDTKVSS
jgi:TNF receptor-associated protein 1